MIAQMMRQGLFMSFDAFATCIIRQLRSVLTQVKHAMIQNDLDGLRTVLRDSVVQDTTAKMKATVPARPKDIAGVETKTKPCNDDLLEWYKDQNDRGIVIPEVTPDMIRIYEDDKEIKWKKAPEGVPGMGGLPTPFKSPPAKAGSPAAPTIKERTGLHPRERQLQHRRQQSGPLYLAMWKHQGRVSQRLPNRGVNTYWLS